MDEYTTHFVISKDGTKIGYRQLGAGDGVVLVHGGLMSGQNFTELGKALAKNFTVYIPDRQGRGMSGTHPHFSLAAESEDLHALIEHTKARCVFGLSSGAIITLQTAITFPGLKKIALYEPPVPQDGIIEDKWQRNYEKAIEKENYGKAFVQILKGTGDTGFFALLPGFITAPFINMAVKAENKKMKEGNVSLQLLIGLFRYDIQVVNESQGIIEKSKNMETGMLLLGGARSQRFLKRVLDRMSVAFPAAQRITFPKVGHVAANNDQQPGLVAQELIHFFKS